MDLTNYSFRFLRAFPLISKDKKLYINCTMVDLRVTFAHCTTQVAATANNKTLNEFHDSSIGLSVMKYFIKGYRYQLFTSFAMANFDLILSD